MGIRRGSISTPIIADGLVFNMDAANRASYVPYATQAFDTIDSSISGSLTNNTSYDPAYNGYWDFDGVDDYIDCGISPLYRLSLYSFSICAWGYITISNLNGVARGLVGTAWDPSSGGFWLAFDDRGGVTSPDNGVAWNIKNTGGYSRGRTDNDVITGDGWYNVVLTYDSVTSKCYVNGVESTNLTTNQSGNYSPKNAILTIGAIIYSNPEGDMLGQISNTQIYNHALSASEVLHNYNALKGRFV